jgi:hypothetical protein
MDNLQHALMFDSGDGDGFLDDCMPFILDMTKKYCN